MVVSDESEPVVSERRGSSESGRAELPPLSESGVAVGFEDGSNSNAGHKIEQVRQTPLSGLRHVQYLARL